MSRMRSRVFLLLSLGLLLQGCTFLPTSMAEADSAWRSTFYLPLDFITSGPLISIFAAILILFVGIELARASIVPVVKALIHNVSPEEIITFIVYALGLAFVSVLLSVVALTLLSGLQKVFVEALNVIVGGDGWGLSYLFTYIDVPKEAFGADFADLIQINFALGWALVSAIAVPLVHAVIELYYGFLVGKAVVLANSRRQGAPLMYWFLGALVRSAFPIVLTISVGTVKWAALATKTLSNGTGEWVMHAALWVPLIFINWASLWVFDRYKEDPLNFRESLAYENNPMLHALNSGGANAFGRGAVAGAVAGTVVAASNPANKAGRTRSKIRVADLVNMSGKNDRKSEKDDDSKKRNDNKKSGKGKAAQRDANRKRTGSGLEPADRKSRMGFNTRVDSSTEPSYRSEIDAASSTGETSVSEARIDEPTTSDVRPVDDATTDEAVVESGSATAESEDIVDGRALEYEPIDVPQEEPAETDADVAVETEAEDPVEAKEEDASVFDADTSAESRDSKGFTAEEDAFLRD